MVDSTMRDSNILIVDDQQLDIDSLAGIFDALGFTNYISTKDSREATKLFDEFKPDIVLLELNMPHLTGFEVMLKLKTLIPHGIYLPILIFTANLTSDAKQDAIAGGATDFLTKPFDLFEVNLRMNNLLKTRSLHKQLKDLNQNLEEKLKERSKELEKENSKLNTAKENSEIQESGKRKKSQTILYIEDDLSNIQLVEEIIKTHRPSINLVTDIYGKNAVQFAVKYKPDLILLDLNLPDIHGSEVIKLLQSETETAEIPVIILSAYTMSRQIEILLSTGAKDYLIKPIDVMEFLKKVDGIFN